MELWKMCGLEAWLDEIETILKGFRLPFSHFYKTKSGFSDMDVIVEDLVKSLPKSISTDEHMLYACFFKMSIAFLAGTCAEDDKRFYSLCKIADIVAPRDDGKVTFSIMIDQEMNNERKKTEDNFFAACVEAHKAFYELFPNNFDATQFKDNVKGAIEEFMRQKGMWITKEQIDKSDISAVLDWAKTSFAREHYSVIGEYDEE